MNKIWTKEKCKEEAKKYSSRSEFQKNCQSAYNAALKNKWLKDYKWFKERFIWTYEKCKEEASKYSSRNEFRKGNSSAYNAARKNNWLKDYDWFINGKITWTYENCKEEAKKYSSRGEFEKENNGAYQVARKNNWLKDYDWFINGKIKWTYKTCKEEAKKYSSRKEFQKGSGGAYNAARKKKWLDKFYKEKHNLNDPRCVYSYEFFITESTKAVYVGITYMWRIKIRDNEHRTRKDSVSSFSKKYNIPIPEVKILEEGITINLKNKEDEWLNKKYRKEGNWIIINKIKGGNLGCPKIWTYEKCKEEAKKYSSRKEFENGSGGAYDAAWRNKWLDEFFGEKRIKENGYWTYERCFEEAKKYSSKKEFRKGNCSAYQAALRNNWLKDYDWFINGKIKWTKERCKEEAKNYSSRKKFEKGNKSAYKAAWKNKWLDEFFPKSAPKIPLAS